MKRETKAAQKAIIAAKARAETVYMYFTRLSGRIRL